MNYDKQKPLTNEEVNTTNNLSSLYFISDIPTYPKGNIHMKVNWDLPITITRNEDEVWLNQNETNKENYWLVYPNDKAESTFNLQAMQFKKIEDAINYSVSNYKEWLKSRLELIRS